MTMLSDDIHRIAVKLPFATPGEVDAHGAIAVFHDWIRSGDVTPGLLIDVADYRHVPDGPGVLLIGHEWDRSLDFGGGWAGVRSLAKRGLTGTLAERIRLVLTDALHTAMALAGTRGLGAAAAVDVGVIEVALLDRLAAPNTTAAADALADVLVQALSPVQVTGVQSVDDDPRRPLAVRVALAETPDAAVLAGRLAAAAAGPVSAVR